MAKSFLTALQVARLSADPSNGSSGQVYFNTTTNKFRGYTTYWQDLGSGSGSGGGGGSNFITTDTIAAPTEFWVGTGDPTNQAIVGDLWLDGSQYDNTEYVVIQDTPPSSNYGLNTLWADTTDSSLSIIPADVVDPTTTPTVGDYFVNLSDNAGQLMVDTYGIAPDPTQVQYWIDDSDTNNAFNYSSLTFAQYPSYSNLPSASSSDGMFVYVQNTGNPYYSANGQWNRIPQAVVIETSLATTNVNIQNEQTLRWMGI